MDLHENKKAALRFRKEIIASMSPREQIILRFDLAWKAANEGDYDRLMMLLMLMRQSLNFDENPQIALSFLRVYNYCGDALEKRRDFAEVAQIMFHFKRAFTIAQDNAGTPEVWAEQQLARAARTAGVSYFGQKGEHFGPRSAEERKLRNKARQDVAGKKA
jgi:hypothetical protein